MDVRGIFEEEGRRLGVSANLRIEPRRTIIASASLRTDTVYVNRDFLPRLGERELRYVIAHQLAHLKLRQVHHSDEFWGILDGSFPDRAELEESLNEKFSRFLGEAHDRGR